MSPRALPKPLAEGEVALLTGASFVYQAFDADDELLYVGVTDSVFQRLGGHLTARSPWVNHAVRVKWAEYGSRELAEMVERRLIETLLPRFNVAHNGRRLPADRMGHRTVYPLAAWRRLGKVVRSRRESMRIPQKRIAPPARIELEVWRSIEAGDAVEYPRSVLTSLEYVLEWEPGSVEAVLAGGSPTLTDEDTLIQRAQAAHRQLSLVGKII